MESGVSMRKQWCMCVIVAGCVLAGCIGQRDSEVVVYTALDSVFSEEILQEFSEETGITTWPKFDTESTKTVGLAKAIIAEAKRPRCDVFWNNEILHTLRLERGGLLDVYHSPMGEAYPEMFRDADGRWHGFAARARILIVNTDLVPEAERPSSIYDLADAKWRGKVSIAKPLFGTTATHAACLFSVLGEEAAKKFFRSLKANDIRIESGNKQVAISVAKGESAFGLTDTDDALVMMDQAYPVAIIYPDRQPDQLGTLFIPNTLAVIKGAPNPENARRLIDWLLRPEIETRLALGPSGQIPLNRNVDVELRVESPRTVKAMDVDFADATDHWDAAATFMRDQFTVD
jgi:iron(III) transport system substrate-binding protein